MSIRPLVLLIVIVLALGAGYLLGTSRNQPAGDAPQAAAAAPLDLRAPAPRDAQGKPDLSGVWQAEGAPLELAVKLIPDGVDGAQTPGESVPSKYFMNAMWDLKPDEVTMTPEALAVFQQRGASFGRDMPSSFCLPLGVPLMDVGVTPHKIVHTRESVIFLYEEMTMFREIFTDGRPLPADPEPAFVGYSAGRWEGDTFVVDVTGFRDNGWLDAFGHPHSSGMKVTERFTRRDVGTMDVQVTVDDPKIYSKPFTYAYTKRLMPGVQIFENFCENEKFRSRLAKQEAAAVK